MLFYVNVESTGVGSEFFEWTIGPGLTHVTSFFPGPLNKILGENRTTKDQEELIKVETLKKLNYDPLQRLNPQIKLLDWTVLQNDEI